MTKKEFLKLIDGMSSHASNGWGLCHAYGEASNRNILSIEAIEVSELMAHIREVFYKPMHFSFLMWLGKDTTTDERITILCLLEHSQTHPKYGYKDYLNWEN